jgi:hypothetical protein
MTSRSLWIRLLIVVLAFLQSGCMTSALNGETKYSREQINGFYLSADDKTLAIVGEKHHYIFPLRLALNTYLLLTNVRKSDRNSARSTCLPMVASRDHIL